MAWSVDESKQPDATTMITGGRIPIDMTVIAIGKLELGDWLEPMPVDKYHNCDVSSILAAICR
jgi:hypothetical protein